MIKEPTAEQSREALRVLIHTSSKGFKAKLISEQERHTLPESRESREWQLLPAFIVDSRYWCGWDVFFGHDIVVDILIKKSYTSTKGIFEPSFVFISDYYGFDKGAFYFRTTLP